MGISIINMPGLNSFKVGVQKQASNYIFVLAPFNDVTTDVTNNYTVTGGTLSSAVQDPWGGNGKVLYFNNSSYMTTDLNFSMLPSAFTIETWARAINIDNDGIIGTTSSSTRFGFSFYDGYNDNNTVLFHNQNGDISVPATTHTWIHLAVTKNDTNLANFYVNGNLKGSRNNLIPPDNNMVIGTYYSTGFPLYGYIGSIAISDKVLPTSDFMINKKPV